jgi:hypothetical protein
MSRGESGVDHIPTDEERGIPSLKERVAKAFISTIQANDAVLTQDQIRAIQIICADFEFAVAVRDYLNSLYPVKKPTSADKPQI